MVPALPMGMALEGGQGGELDTEGGDSIEAKCVGEGRVRRLFYIYKLAPVGAFELYNV